MTLHRSLRLAVLLAIVMIALLVPLTVGWVLLTVFGALKDDRFAAVYWILLSIGSSFIGMLLAGVILYLILSIKAIALNRRQSNFIDSVTHELKSPIASMKLYLQTLGRHQVSPDEQAGFFRFMIEDLDRLDHLINQLLDAGRVESGRVDAEVEDVALAPLLRDCAQTVCLRYRMPCETVRFDLAPCTVRAWRVDLDVLFRNLIDNAVKYAAHEPQVEVSLRPAANARAVVRIADNGRGIPHKFRRHIFHRFERLGLELEREKPGTGLGLYIVRNLARRLRAKVRVRDREGGPGTVFEVQLPGVVPAEPEAKPANPSHPSDPSGP
ncbi:MAG: HAMP domain-containing sensor histidine kinase [Thermoguttaceae bacterium]|jgi:signal transduction histidine kinase